MLSVLCAVRPGWDISSRKPGLHTDIPLRAPMLMLRVMSADVVPKSPVLQSCPPNQYFKQLVMWYPAIMSTPFNVRQSSAVGTARGLGKVPSLYNSHSQWTWARRLTYPCLTMPESTKVVEKTARSMGHRVMDGDVVCRTLAMASLRKLL